MGAAQDKLHTVKYPRAFAIFALGLLLQGCSLQKRSLMPGWHLVRIDKTSATAPTKIGSSNRNDNARECAELPHSKPRPQEAPAALNSRKPQRLFISATNELIVSQTQPLPLQSPNALEPTQVHRIEEDEVRFNAFAPGVIGAILGFCLATLFAGLGAAFTIYAIGFSNFWFGFWGLVLLILSVLMFKKIGPVSTWRRRTVWQVLAEFKERVGQARNQSAAVNDQEAAEQEAQREAQRAAEKEELRLQREEKMREVEEIRRQRAEEKQARAARRKAFFQQPFIKTALGFLVIVGLYLLLF